MRQISHRQKTKFTREVKDKELKRLYQEWLDLQQNRTKLGTWVPIDPPYQQGLIRCWKVRSDVVRSPVSQRAHELLDVIQVREESRTGKFTYWDKQTGHFKDRPLAFRKVDKEAWKYAEYLKKFFVLIPFRVQPQSAIIREYYVLRVPWFFEETRYPRMVTRQFIPNSEVETRLQELYTKLFHTENVYRLYSIHDWTMRDDPWDLDADPDAEWMDTEVKEILNKGES